MKRPIPGLKMKMIAHGLNISALRRDNLYALTFGLVQAHSQHRDLNRLAAEMLALTQQPHELQFMCSSFDAVLKKYFGAPLRARAVLVTALRHMVEGSWHADQPNA